MSAVSTLRASKVSDQQSNPEAPQLRGLFLFHADRSIEMHSERVRSRRYAAPGLAFIQAWAGPLCG